MANETKKIETREVLAGAYRGSGLDRFLLSHAVELDGDGTPVRVLCGRVDLENIADANASNTTDTPSCGACRSAERVRLNRESRHDSIVRWLGEMSETPAEQLRWIDDDREWFFVWSAALGVGATCPSNTTRQMVRDTIRTQLPELHVLSAEERDILAELEAARGAASGAVYEPDLDTAEDELER